MFYIGDSADSDIEPVDEWPDEVIYGRGREVIERIWNFWHRKLGHVNEEILQNLTEQAVGVQLQVPENDTFENCLECRKLPVENLEDVIEIRQSDRPLELLHVHVTKPVLCGTTAEEKFVIVIVDDFSNFCQVNFCQNELEMLIHVEYFVHNSKQLFTIREVDFVLVEGSTIEFYELVLKWARLRGIGIASTTKKPRAWPKAARLLNILLRRAQALISDCEYENFFFWGESIEAAANLFNISTIIDNRTPYEYWFGLRPRLEKMKRFGIFVVDEDKIVHSRKPYAYVGLEHHSHKVWNPYTRRIKYISNVSEINEYEDPGSSDHLKEQNEKEVPGNVQNQSHEERQKKDNLSSSRQFMNFFSVCIEMICLKNETVENVRKHHNNPPSMIDTLKEKDYPQLFAMAWQLFCRPRPPNVIKRDPRIFSTHQ